MRANDTRPAAAGSRSMATGARLVAAGSRLVAADLRLVGRDPLLCIMPFVPFLAAIALRLALPPLAAFIAKATGFMLLDYADLIRVVLILFPGTFFGMMSGFLLLDDRDDGVSAYWSVSPVGRSGYLAARLALFCTAALVAGLAVGPAFGLGGRSFAADASVAVVGALQAPFFALFLAAIASDKVEGLATLKALSALDLAPLAVLLPLPARALAWPFPQYWAARLALGASLGPGTGVAVGPPEALGLGLAVSAAWLSFLYARYRRRVD
ncbi:MAG TPA: hypothetical protein PLE25_01925 [Spirochaetales bacterium]|nr:hypothetical protein [Spirochaetales bacterium]